jgi:hypothetical protein
MWPGANRLYAGRLSRHCGKLAHQGCMCGGGVVYRPPFHAKMCEQVYRNKITAMRSRFPRIAPARQRYVVDASRNVRQCRFMIFLDTLEVGRKNRRFRRRIRPYVWDWIADESLGHVCTTVLLPSASGVATLDRAYCLKTDRVELRTDRVKSVDISRARCSSHLEL